MNLRAYLGELITPRALSDGDPAHGALARREFLAVLAGTAVSSKAIFDMGRSGLALEPVTMPAYEALLGGGRGGGKTMVAVNRVLYRIPFEQFPSDRRVTGHITDLRVPEVAT